MIRPWQRWSLWVKIFVSMLAVSVPVILLLGTISFVQGHEMDKETTQTYLKNEVDSSLEIMKGKATTAEGIINALSFNNAIGNTFESQATQRDIYAAYLNFRDYVDPTQKVLMTLNPDLQRIDYYTDSQVAGMRENVHSLQDKTNPPFVAKLGYSENPQWFADSDHVYAIRAFPISITPETHTLVMLTYDRPTFFAPLVKKNAMLIFTVTNAAGQTIFTDKRWNSRQFTAGGPAIRIGTTGWQLRMQYDGALDRDNRIVSWTIIGVIISLALIMLLTRYFTNMISANFRRLKGNIQQVIADPAQNVSFTTNEQDEFGQLSNSVGAMVDQLKALNDQAMQAEIEKQSSKYDALVNQINSHFLYNTLSMIDWQARQSGNPVISMAVRELSTFYRTTLNHGHSGTLLKNEIDNIKAYITLQLVLHDTFQVSYDIDPRLLRAKAINLMIQPIVENAIEHGLHEEKADAEIFISVRQEADQLWVQVTDNGVGIAPAQLPLLLSREAAGYGLRNVDQRIKFYFGPAYGLTIDSQLGVGTSVTIKLPLLIEEEKTNGSAGHESIDAPH